MTVFQFTFNDEKFKAKKHPGVVFRGKVCLPNAFSEAAETILSSIQKYSIHISYNV